MNAETERATQTKAEQAELRKLDRKIMGGKATRKEILRGIELKQAATARAALAKASPTETEKRS